MSENKQTPLHLKYRPNNFEEFFGNEEMIVSLKSILSRKEGIPHVFLFIGSSGCGKTTLARIIKGELDCSDSDFYEYNVANVRGIDTIREIIANSNYSPLSGKCRIYLLDEAHKLTNDAQNALLKLLEDTPEHIFFILCSTEPEKILKTVRTRCTTFQVRNLSLPKISSLLKFICEKEGVSLPKEAYTKIANASGGSPRQALVILDQVIDIADDEKLLNSINKVIVDETLVIDLCRALVGRQSWQVISSLLKDIQEEPEKIRYSILGYLSQVLLKNGDNKISILLSYFLDSYIYTGKAGLILSCFKCVNSREK